MSVKKQSIEHMSDNSDVLSLLQSIETMFVTCQNVLNTYSQTALMLAITTEAEMLLIKLQVMKERWTIHLPFKEASTVDFFDWGKKMEQMSQTIGGAEVTGDSEKPLMEYCPSKHFMLDLYEKLDESPSHTGGTPYYSELNVTRLIASQDRIRKHITRQWAKYKYSFSDLVANELNLRIGNVLLPLADRSVNIRMTCYEVLHNLSALLYELYEMPKGAIPHDQFARLAERVINEPEYGGRKAQISARHDVDTLKNATPEEEWDERREGEIKASIDLLGELKHGRKVFSFLGRNATIKDNPAGMGRFLNSIRCYIKEEELFDVIEQLHRIQYLREDEQQSEGTEVVPEPESTQGTQLAQKDAATVRRKRIMLQPACPKLPLFFSEALASNATVISEYYKILHRCGFYIGRPLLEAEKRDPKANCYEGWKWKHLREAFIKLGFMPGDSPKKGFADYLASVFPYLESVNVQRGFNSRGGYEDPTATRRIIADIISEFEDVRRMIEM